MIAPMDDPEMATGLIPSSSRASMTWICASPRAPPPPNANATLGVEVISLRFLRRTVLLGVFLPDHQHGRLHRQQLCRNSLHVVECNRIIEAFQLVEIVDRPVEPLEIHKRAGDLAGRV